MPINTAPVTEHEIACKAVAPRVTETDLEDAIESSFYFTAAQGVAGAKRDIWVADEHEGKPLGLLTICVLVLENGYTVTGTSACASPANFDADIGKRIARADAVRQVWPLLGYALRDKVHHAAVVEAAVAALEIAAENCETNAPLWSACGNDEEAKFSSANAASCRAAIARLVP